MNIELTPEQSKELLRAVHIATHIDERRVKKGWSAIGPEDLERILCEQALSEGMDAVEMSEKGPVLSSEFVEPIHKALDEREDELFWTRLADEMGERDMAVSYRERELDAMDHKEYDDTLAQFSKPYDEEFESHGVDHVTVEHPLTMEGR